MAKRKVNKSAEIRSYLKGNPTAKPKQVSVALKKRGIDASPAYISALRSTDKARNGHQRPTPSRRLVSTRSASQSALAQAMPSLMHAKRLVDQLGSIDKAREALDALAKLS